MQLFVALVLFAVLCALGVSSGLYFNRYVAAMARELGKTVSQVRVGPVDDAGQTAYDRELFRGVLFGNYGTTSPNTIRLGRTARALFGASAVALVLFVTWLSNSGVLQGNV
jgi:hypothetical protein